MERRVFLRTVGAGAGIALAGCTSSSGGGDGSGNDSGSGSGGGNGSGGDSNASGSGGGGGGKNTVTFGVLGPKSGALSNLWESYISNIELAVDQINNDGNFVHDGGGIDVGGSKKQLEFVAYDTEAKPNTGVNAAERLIGSDDVPVILGPMSSTTTLAIMDVTKKRKTPQITSVAVNEKITGKEGTKWMYRNKDTDSMRAKWISKAIADELEFESVGMVGPNNDFGIGRMDAFATALGDRNVKTLTKQSFNPDKQSYLPELQSIKSEDPDALYMMLNDPATAEQMVPEARQVGFENVIGTGPVGKPELSGKIGDPLKGVYVEVTFPNSAGGSAKHVTRWAKNLDSFTDGKVSPDYIGAPTYDAVNAIAGAVSQAGAADATKIRDAMGKTKMKGVYPYPDFRLEFDTHNQAQVVSGLGQWLKKGNGWSLDVITGPFADG